jgi:tetratricopeptide (TPR) repeat protein
MTRLCALTVMLVLLAGQADTPAARIAAAAALIAKRDAASALKLVEPLLTDPAVIADDRLYAAALRQAGGAWFQMNDYPKALDAFQRALASSRKAGDKPN